MTVSRENCYSNPHPLDHFCLPPFKKSGYGPVSIQPIMLIVLQAPYIYYAQNSASILWKGLQA